MAFFKQDGHGPTAKAATINFENAIAKLNNLPPNLQSLNVTIIQIMQLQSNTDAAGPALPQYRLLSSCARSGSMLLSRIFAEAPECAVASRINLMGNRSVDSGQKVEPDCRILAEPETLEAYQQAIEKRRSVLVSKEEFGNGTRKAKLTFNVLPLPLNYNAVKPVFLIRDPVRIFDSWKHHGWMSMQSLFDSFESHCKQQTNHTTAPPYTVVYEKLVHNTELEIRRICSYWGIEFNPNMINFKKDFGDLTLNTLRGEDVHGVAMPLGLFETVGKYSSVQPDIPPHGMLSNQEKYDIECRLAPLYLRCWKTEIDNFSLKLANVKWFAFDLDDTLHEFRLASGAAITAVLHSITEELSSQHPLLSFTKVQTEYTKVLATKTSSAFVDGKTSHQYREDRIRTTLSAFSITPTDSQIASWVTLYESVLMQNHELKCGVLDLFATLKLLGKKIAIITEGPQDAQERTIAALGLTPDYLATTNKLSVSKSSGLFPKVLEELHVKADEMVMVGDNFDRDMKPAMEAGMHCVHYAENEHFTLDMYPVKVNTLKKLELMFRHV